MNRALAMFLLSPMPMLQEQPAPKRRSFWVVRLPVPVLVVITALTGASVIYRTHLNRQLGERLRALKEAGQPVTFQAMDSVYPEVELRKNAALVFSLALSKRRVTNDAAISELTEQLRRMPPSSALSNAQQLAIRRRLATDRETMTLLHQAATLSASRYPITLRKDGGAELPHLRGFVPACNLLLLEGALAAETNDVRVAIRSVRTLLALGQSVVSEPTLLSQAHRWRCQQIAVTLTSRIISRRELADRALLELQRAFDGMEASPGLLPALYMERCFGLAVNHKLLVKGLMKRDDLYGWFSGGMFHLFLRASGRVEADRLFFLDTVGSYIACFDEPFPKRLQLATDIHVYSRAKKQMLYVSAFLCPVYERVIPDQAHAVAYIRIAQAMLAVERFHRAKRQMPESLAELTPDYLRDAAVDPYNGEALRITRQRDTYTIYSVGENLQDNDGRREGNLDLAITVAIVPTSALTTDQAAR